MTQVNQTIQWVPQGEHPTAQALKLSIACELLANSLYDMEAYFGECKLRRVEPDFYSIDSWENFLASAKFLNENRREKIDTTSVEEYVALYLAKNYPH